MTQRREHWIIATEVSHCTNMIICTLRLLSHHHHDNPISLPLVSLLHLASALGWLAPLFMARQTVEHSFSLAAELFSFGQCIDGPLRLSIVDVDGRDVGMVCTMQAQSPAELVTT